jgi:hypothetical protein
MLDPSTRIRAVTALIARNKIRAISNVSKTSLKRLKSLGFSFVCVPGSGKNSTGVFSTSLQINYLRKLERIIKVVALKGKGKIKKYSFTFQFPIPAR